MKRSSTYGALWQKKVGCGGEWLGRLGNVLLVEGHADNGGHVRLGSEDVNGQLERVAHFLHDAQALLVVGTAASHVDRDAVVDELLVEFVQRLDDALEGGRHVGEVGDAAADEQHLAVGVLLLGHQVEDGLGVLVRLLLARSARVLAVVGQLRLAAEIANRVAVDDTRAAAGHHRPYAALRVQYGQLERGA